MAVILFHGFTIDDAILPLVIDKRADFLGRPATRGFPLDHSAIADDIPLP